MEALSECHDNNRLDKFIKRLSEGHLCYGHKENNIGDVCSYFWVSDGQNVDHAPFAYNFKICIPQNTIYVADCRVDKRQRHRSKKLYTSGLIEIFNLYKNKKFHIL